MKQSYSHLTVTVLDPEQHERTCNYWYLVRQSFGPHTAFHSKQGLEKWLDERGLKLTEPLTEPGTFSWQHINGSYNTEMHYSESEVQAFHNLKPVVVSRTLSNGEYVVAKITEDNGIRTVHTLNPNVKDRITFDYRESHRMMN